MKSRVIFRDGIMEKSKQDAFEELLERAQILIDKSYDECAEAIHQTHRATDICSEAHLKVTEKLGEHATKSHLIYAVLIAVLTSTAIGWLAHG